MSLDFFLQPMFHCKGEGPKWVAPFWNVREPPKDESTAGNMKVVSEKSDSDIKIPIMKNTVPLKKKRPLAPSPEEGC